MAGINKKQQVNGQQCTHENGMLQINCNRVERKLVMTSVSTSWWSVAHAEIVISDLRRKGWVSRCSCHHVSLAHWRCQSTCLTAWHMTHAVASWLTILLLFASFWFLVGRSSRQRRSSQSHEFCLICQRLPIWKPSSAPWGWVHAQKGTLLGVPCGPHSGYPGTISGRKLELMGISMEIHPILTGMFYYKFIC